LNASINSFDVNAIVGGVQYQQFTGTARQLTQHQGWRILQDAQPVGAILARGAGAAVNLPISARQHHLTAIQAVEKADSGEDIMGAGHEQPCGLLLPAECGEGPPEVNEGLA
jgi:hypothetical protein